VTEQEEMETKNLNFCLNTKKNRLFYGGSGQQRLPGEVVESPSLGMFITQRNMAMSNLL